MAWPDSPPPLTPSAMGSGEGPVPFRRLRSALPLARIAIAVSLAATFIFLAVMFAVMRQWAGLAAAAPFAALEGGVAVVRLRRRYGSSGQNQGSPQGGAGSP